MSRLHAVYATVVVGVLAAALVTTTATGQSRARAKTSVAVTMKEYSFTLSTKTVPKGSVSFQVVNKGKIKHNFQIAGKKTPSLKPGAKATLTVSFAKKGRYPYVCTIDSHKKFGMKGVLTVK